jgi:alanine dehydrogenase
MNFGIPKERRPFEYRVGLSPAGVEMLADQGHTVFVEHEAGVGAGFSDYEYEKAGAKIAYSPQEVFGRADVLLKISRPLREEIDWLQPGATLMGLLHLGSTKQESLDALAAQKITAIAYEQIKTEKNGCLPVLRPMSQIGGQMTAQIATRWLQSDLGGKGILLGGIPGVPPAEVVIIGGGVVGMNALTAFLGLGAHVTVMDKEMSVLQRVNDRFPQVVTMISTRRNIDRACAFADVVVGAVLVVGERAPIVLTRETLKQMKPRSMVIDMSIDEGGCFETSRPMAHDRPTFVEDGIIHYCVPNVPSLVARTATHAFVNAAMPYILKIAAQGVEKAIQNDKSLEMAVNMQQGETRNLLLWSAQKGS